MSSPPEPKSEHVPPALLEILGNLARFHREHEKFYSQAPLGQAARIQATSRALKALADRWAKTSPQDKPAAMPIAAAEDLNDPSVVAERGILFLEDEREPVEIERLKRDLRTMAGDNVETGEWMAEAMERAWAIAGSLARYPELADMLGERHRIIANDLQAAGMSALAGRLLHRAVDLLDVIDFSAPGLREDLAGGRRAPGYLHSASELLDRAADLLAQSATLTHENDRRWRLFAQRLESLRVTDEAEGA